MNAKTTPLHPGAPPASLFRRVMGADYDMLPDQIRSLHDSGMYLSATGQADVVHGPGFWAGMIHLFGSFPAKGHNVPVTVEFIVERDGERWRRNFNSKIFASRLSPGGKSRSGKLRLKEKHGAFTVLYELAADAHGITWHQVGMRFLGLPAPGFLRFKITARESVEHGRYMFDSNVALPGGGRIVHYRGWLMADEPISEIPHLEVMEPVTQVPAKATLPNPPT